MEGIFRFFWRKKIQKFRIKKFGVQKNSGRVLFSFLFKIFRVVASSSLTNLSMKTRLLNCFCNFVHINIAASDSIDLDDLSP